MSLVESDWVPEGHTHNAKLFKILFPTQCEHAEVVQMSHLISKSVQGRQFAVIELL